MNELWAEAITDSWWHQLNLDEQYIQEQAMHVKDMIESKFLRKEDFDEDTVVTIKGLKQENLGKADGPLENRWVLFFREYPKGMVMNVTTIRVLEQAYGSESDAWVGKQVTMYVDPSVSFQGRVVGGLRLRPLKQKSSAAASKAPVDEYLEDGAEPPIPF